MNGIYNFCEDKRKKLGMNKNDFCLLLRISKPTYWRMSKGQISPNVLKKISERFSITKEGLVRKNKR